MRRETTTTEYDELGRLVKTTHTIEITKGDEPVSHTLADDTQQIGWRYDSYTDSWVPLMKDWWKHQSI